MERSNVVLTDFSEKRWRDIDLVNIPSILFHLNLRSKSDMLYGGIYFENFLSKILPEIVFLIKDLEFKDNKIIGNISYFQTQMGSMIYSLPHTFEINCKVQYFGNKMILDNISTWNANINEKA
jgi:hypothetical protein